MERNDQRWAVLAFDQVARVGAEEREEYRTLALGLGAFVRKNGLAATLSFYQRDSSSKASCALFDHIAEAGIHMLHHSGSRPESALVELPRLARALPMQDYVIATRQFLRFAQWLKRAVQATISG